MEEVGEDTHFSPVRQARLSLGALRKLASKTSNPAKTNSNDLLLGTAMENNSQDNLIIDLPDQH
jgi:hypothetical protein